MNSNDRSIIGFVMVSHAIVHTYELSIPILMVLWLSEFSVSTALLGVVVAVGYGLFGVGALPGGILVDRFGSQELVTACLVGMGASFLVLSIAPNVLMIMVALCIWGLAASVYHPAGLSLISKGVEERGTGFAYHGMAGNLGIALGPLLTAVLLLFFEWRLVTALLIAPAAVAVLYALSVEFDETAAAQAQADGGTPASDTHGMTWRQFVADSRSLFTVGFTIAFFLVMMNGLFYRGMLTFLPDVLSSFLPNVVDQLQLFDPESPMAEEFDPASYLYAGLLMVGIAGQYVGGKLTDRVRTEIGLAVVIGSLTIVAIAFVPAAETGVVPLLVVSALLGFLLFALQPLYQATIAEYSPPGDRGLSYGYTYLGSFGIGAGGAVIAGYLLSAGGVERTFLGLAVFPIVGAALSLALLRYGVPRE
ncbi:MULTISPECIES: MFS transporter [Natrialbaceae]|uniref:MFS transporter n=1 Tax=Natrialbaceae TaxID=1644061 RepID=UPI00207D5D28|nr:MFS transporter [Natronococcus sp. CG52]